MPKKVPGKHQLHINISKQHFQLLQEYCEGSIERVTATGIVRMLIETYIENYLRPRLRQGEVANYQTVWPEMGKAVSLAAHKIEPSAFDKPTDT